MGPWGDGFDDGFGPLDASGTLSAALLSQLGIINNNKEYSMEQVRIAGVNASGMIRLNPTQYALIKSIEIDVPLDEVGTTDPTVTLSGAITGAQTYHSDTTLELKFAPNEDIYITSDSFTAEYTAIIRYQIAGDMNSYMQTDRTRQDRGEVMYFPTPWRLR